MEKALPAGVWQADRFIIEPRVRFCSQAPVGEEEKMPGSLIALWAPFYHMVPNLTTLSVSRILQDLFLMSVSLGL